MEIRLFNLLFFLILTVSLGQAQSNQPPYTPAAERIQSFAQRKALIEQSLVANVPFKSIGPTVFSGRVADIEVNPEDPTVFYVAYASGGLWKTTNNGQSFTPLFDDEMVMTIGDIAVDWKNEVIWVGTGEVNSSRSSYSGTGVFVSRNGGKTWTHTGLGESHHIGKVLLHPTNPDIAWVAALGHLYSPNVERGIFRTTDGGKTWQHVLFVDANTGAVDLVLDPRDPNVLYAAMWHRERRAWNFVESGEGSGIFKSTDGGTSWVRMNTPESGFPTGKGVGRIGLDAVDMGTYTRIYAVVDNQNPRPKAEDKKQEGLTKLDFKEMTIDAFLALDDDDLKKFLEDNEFPKKYSASQLKKMVRKGEISPSAIYDYLYNANEDLFNAEIIGAEVYFSEDGGQTWKRTHDDYLDRVYFTYGYYFGKIHVHPGQPDKIYIYGVPILKSLDGGKSFININGENVHVDHHAMWIDPKREGHLIIGNDGGVNISYDDGENWIKCNTPPVGQFYYIAVDDEERYNVYGGTQDNGVWYGPHDNEPSVRWHGTGDYPFKMLLGGDGMQVAVDTRDNNTVYTGFQFGNYFRIDKKSGRRKHITPRHDLGERPLRWNWQTPIHLSVHNQDILYIGANKLYRSMTQGDDWEAISGDLTQGEREGDVPYGTLTAIHESPLKFGLLYAGTDDGLVWVTRDGGETWQRITDGLPENMYVSRIQASSHARSRVYLALNGYRWDNFEAMVYRSDNYGQSWQRIGTDLPLEPVNVIKEDPHNENVIYVGTDHGVYVSLDGGLHFMAMKKGLPAAPVHDLVIHPKAKELVVGTHGRSIYVADVSHLEQLTDSVILKDLYVFDLPKVKQRGTWGAERRPYSGVYNEPEILLPVYVRENARAQISVYLDDLQLASWSAPIEKGLNYLPYPGTIDKKTVEPYQRKINEKAKERKKTITLEEADSGKYYLQKGEYRVVFQVGEHKVEKKLIIE